MRVHKQTDDNALQQVRDVYDDLARRPFERQCINRAECCHFKLTGKTPWLTRGEARLAARGLLASGRKSLPESREGACPLLDAKTSRCLIYENRPFGCRTHFCAAAGGTLPRREILDLIRRLEEIDADLGGDGPHPIVPAIRQALAVSFQKKPAQKARD